VTNAAIAFVLSVSPITGGDTVAAASNAANALMDI